ncbi:pyridoxamine 5'-phosphate oxidase family protein [Luteolibacter flavescens]|uniref:Pyridoxamine 5'-phosphate oxidase family protein n=1 Tax=Luteolibacter flavescens TaxID=1859460 RepID=A0ABT3FKQ8_9BACT|nr:pyridoxamine 5'-phosphate oxidase family protein [Luteolibacter flavescens]MCW1884171.1 pyridoxamine 5'-phosphate oxidase family protein [Luteolibacter flavescens]
MNSIHQQQPEDTRDDLHGLDAVAKIQEIVGKSPNCFFSTMAANGTTDTRPMNVRQVDAEGNLWFLSSCDSLKNEEIRRLPVVELYFQGSTHSDFMHLKGEATVSRDQAKIEELWEPVIRTWFTEGKDDPRITVIKVEPVDGYYWDTKHGNAIAGIKMLIGAAIQKTLDDSVEGTLRV